jgi:hypothetical protein
MFSRQTYIDRDEPLPNNKLIRPYIPYENETILINSFCLNYFSHLVGVCLEVTWQKLSSMKQGKAEDLYQLLLIFVCGILEKTVSVYERCVETVG